jgi:glycerol-3-phosphate acyltransferase PlsX
MKIALDVMGGDLAPFSNIEGAFSYIEETKDSDTQLLLVGNKPTIEKVVSQYPQYSNNIQIVHTTEIVEMNEKPSRIFRTKPDSSLVRCIDLVKNGDADAAISAGNTGALLASSLFILGKIHGIRRPALAPYIPTEKGGVILCDAGANADVKPQHLVQFGLMASAYLEVQENIKSPRVALINIGSEEGKGNELTRSAYPLLKDHIDNFVGNIESRYFLNGDVDVVVCDGFTGNIILKLTEGLFKNITEFFKDNLSENGYDSSQLMPIFANLKKKYDYEEHGGTPLLGINGIVMKCHGSSSKRSIKNAIIAVKKIYNSNLINEIAARMSKHMEIFEENTNINESQTA